jgi:hypothetical protein
MFHLAELAWYPARRQIQSPYSESDNTLALSSHRWPENKLKRKTGLAWLYGTKMKRNAGDFAPPKEGYSWQ